MGKCSVCGNKILYNAFKKIKGVIYCLKCEPKPAVKMTFVKDAIEKTIADAKLDFAEFESAMKETAVIAVNEELVKELGEPIKMTVKPKKRKKSKKVKKNGM